MDVSGQTKKRLGGALGPSGPWHPQPNPTAKMNVTRFQSRGQPESTAPAVIPADLRPVIPTKACPAITADARLVIPAKAGIHFPTAFSLRIALSMDSGIAWVESVPTHTRP